MRVIYFIFVFLLSCNTVSAATYSLAVADLWGNGYDGSVVAGKPKYSSGSYLRFTTDAETITISGTTSMYTGYPTYAHLGLIVDGVVQDPLVFTTQGSQVFSSVPIGDGTSKTVEIINGPQIGPTTILESYVTSIDYGAASFAVVPPSATDRVVIYGDSISSGIGATNAETTGFSAVLRLTHGHNILTEAWGFRDLDDDASTAAKITAFVSRVAGYAPSTVVLAIGTNDFSTMPWSAANFGLAYYQVISKLHSELPDARIICMTPLYRTTETGGLDGAILDDYRSQITTSCSAVSGCSLIDGEPVIDADGLADTVHPNTAGHSLIAAALDTQLDTVFQPYAAPMSAGGSLPINNLNSGGVSIALH